MRLRAATIVVCLTLGYGYERLELTPELRAAIERIDPNSLRGDLSFLASDLLEGRLTPSRGLDIAAEYIAAQFRRAALQPGAGVDGYFQTAHLATLEANMDGFELKLSGPDASATIRPSDAVANNVAALDLKSAPIFKFEPAAGFSPEQVQGKILLLEPPRARRDGFEKLRDAKPTLMIVLDRAGQSVRGAHSARLVDPRELDAAIPRITITGEDAVRFYESLKPGSTDAVATVHVAAPHQTPATPHNVIAILRGADPALQDTFVLLTAHYDHLGMRAGGQGDRIYNGANDDGSGTVSVIELARALAPLKPRRSIVFMTFCGEEEGLIGSQYYAHHPTLPLDKIVAQINLEQVGRTDSSEGAQISNAALTGFGYTSLTDVLVEAGEATGVRVYKHPQNSDAYFAASDNLSLAQAGVPAHTLGVSFLFPDYHAVGDEWQKIDYDNMAKVDRMVAVALWMVANNPEAPRWNESDPKAAPYLKAWKARHPN